jgi:hypothetical protein
MRSDDAIALVRDVDILRLRTRRALDSAGFPLLVFGVLTIGSVPVAMSGLNLSLGAYWAEGGIAGLVLVAARFALRERAGLGLGARRARAVAFVATATALLVAAITIGSLGEGPSQGVLPQIAVSTVYLAFALIERRPIIAVGAAVLALVAVAAWTFIAPPGSYVVSSVVYGAALIWAGLVLYRER